MGNANGREDGAIGSDDQSAAGSDIRSSYAPTSQPPVRASSIDPMANSPPPSPGRSRSPVLFAPQAPLAPLQRGNGPHFFNQMWQNESHGIVDQPPERGIPVMITWTYGGNNVVVQGSWDNWTSRKQLQRAGKDHSVVMVLPSGLYHYKFIVDGEQRYIPELPYVADEMGCVCNLLDVNDYVPDIPQSISEFEPPPSPEASYGQAFPAEEDFAKEPMAVPQQLHLTVLGMENSDVGTSSKPQHVVLNHVFIEKNLAAQSVVALGLTHRFQSKYVTVVLYKPLKR
ncbi:SNF1-related protein kinase regulatory subunit beta-1-like isoform X1 [Neltuma alba]|uniref:SNF1-related protein kinase regulatory subunit beta-1-like isoform X1 n=1 Tax=Neltuma alba TaxID=207710 RepID=UPI0010A3D415|nr:SNF1-related protein kinase regulatory subunit beta-1-like isoform X1 [Prosopis alba]